MQTGLFTPSLREGGLVGGPGNTAWTCFRCALPAVARLRCWANAAATHAPPLRFSLPACQQTHTQIPLHVEGHTHTHIRAHPSLQRHINVQSTHLALWNMHLDGQMCKRTRVTHFNEGGGASAAESTTGARAAVLKNVYIYIYFLFYFIFLRKGH